MMNYEEALRVIHEKFWQGSKPGLERTRILLNKMGNPQDHLRFIHVAGTNGKGSFCAMLSSILTKAGLKVGTYTSPYVFRFNERMKICGQDIPDQTLAQLVESIYPLAEEMEEKPTEFEWITAIAMAYFYQEKCDVVVLECGMGGRLDSTNVIQDPSLSVITGIALDHTAILGDSLEKIAREKAGIIKKGRPVLDCTDKGPARDVIARQAKKMNAPLIRPRRSGLVLHRQDLGGTEFSWETWDHLFLPLLGTYQTENAASW